MDNLEREIDPTTPPRKGVPAAQYEDDARAQIPSHMERIVTLIDNPEFTDLEEINREIAREIAVLVTNDDPPGGRFTGRTLSDKVKALRELAKTVQEGDDITKKDFLNFDGPKFKYVLGEVVLLFKKSMTSGGLSEDVTNHVLRVFRDQLQGRAPDLRKETERITADSLLPVILGAPDAPVTVELP